MTCVYIKEYLKSETELDRDNFMCVTTPYMIRC